MSKFESDIRKKLKKIHSEAATKVRKLLKSKKAILVDAWRWNSPTDLQIKQFQKSVDAYLADCGVIKHPSALNIDDIVNDPAAFALATKEELEDFKKKTWPKLYGKWLEAEKKRKAENREADAKNAKKIRAKIAKLQKQLEEVEG